MEQRTLANRYELLELVGSGGMADVYKAHDKLLDRIVAVKVLHAQFASDAEFVARFQSEAKGAAKMSHPNIVNIYDVGQEENSHYIVMEYVSGQTLREELDAGGRLPVATALTIARQIAEALCHACPLRYQTAQHPRDGRRSHQGRRLRHRLCREFSHIDVYRQHRRLRALFFTGTGQRCFDYAQVGYLFSRRRSL